MLPPIPHGLVPVTSQQDVPKPKPAIAPVTPAQETAESSVLGIEKDESSEARERAQEEQRRRYQESREAEQQADEQDQKTDQAEPKDSGGLSRKGLWVDVKV